VNASVIESPLAKFESLLSFQPGDELFREGEPACGIFVLHSGLVDLLFAAANGNVKPLRVASPGQILGLSAVISNHDHDCTARARTLCRAGFIDGEDLHRLLDDQPEVWFSVLSLLSSDVDCVYGDMSAVLAAR
jgi:CRP-like cAMP-binding protein